MGRFLSRFLKRKKRVVLKELEWELVRTFVKEYSEREPEDKAVAAKVTYDVLLAEMKKEYLISIWKVLQSRNTLDGLKNGKKRMVFQSKEVHL